MSPSIHQSHSINLNYISTSATKMNFSPLVLPLTRDLPATKIKRTYKCKQCLNETKNPREHLNHRIQVHREKIKIVECPLCVYACQYRQKLKRHLDLVHHTTFEQVNQLCALASMGINEDDADVDVDIDVDGLDEVDESVNFTSPINCFKFNEFHAFVSQLIPFHGLQDEPNDLSFPETVKQLMRVLY